MRSVDARIEVVFGPVTSVGPADAVLTEGDAGALKATSVTTEWFVASKAPAHPGGCACCAARDPAALALHRLFLARARGAACLFRRVVVQAVSEAGREAVQAAVRDDPVLQSRFRISG